MNDHESYGEKLKDPRWQKLRLQVFERDFWSCQLCGSGERDGIPLCVHHKKYTKGRTPWEYPIDMLITLCEKCHNKFHDKNSDGKEENKDNHLKSEYELMREEHRLDLLARGISEADFLLAGIRAALKRVDKIQNKENSP